MDFRMHILIIFSKHITQFNYNALFLEWAYSVCRINPWFTHQIFSLDVDWYRYGTNIAAAEYLFLHINLWEYFRCKEDLNFDRNSIWLGVRPHFVLVYCWWYKFIILAARRNRKSPPDILATQSFHIKKL